jgi:alkaline phosphatase
MRKLTLFITSIIVMLSLFGCSLFEGKPDTFYYDSINVILIIGDGMGEVHEQVAREVLGGPLEWDSFPIKGKVTTNSTNIYSATDSAAAATAMSTGYKTRNNYLGMSIDGTRYEHIMMFLQTLNKRTGIVTTDEIYEATPSGFSAYSESRSTYEEILLSQLQSKVNLFIGGDTTNVVLNNKKALEKAGYKLLSDLSNIRNRDMYVYSVYPSIDAPENQKENSANFLPLVQSALNFLSRNNPDGFMLLIEGEKMDSLSHAHNSNFVYEVLDLNQVVKEVIKWAQDFPNTLIIVTADHETGGLGILENDSEPNILNKLTWSTTGHTSTPVNYYMIDPRNTAHPATIDNTDIYVIMKHFMETYNP